MLCKDFLKLFYLFLAVESHKSRALIFCFRKFICKSLNLFKPTANILQQNYLQPQQKKSTDLFLKQKYKSTALSNSIYQMPVSLLSVHFFFKKYIFYK